jgi:hypothetical protein
MMRIKIVPKYTDEEIYANRVKVVEFLKEGRRKAHGSLIQGGSRCNIGWMAEALELPKNNGYFVDGNGMVNNSSAPEQLVSMLGLNNSSGGLSGNYNDPKKNPFFMALEKAGVKKKPSNWAENPMSIISLNDETGTTIRQLGLILDQMVCGGPGTPWKAIGKKPKKPRAPRVKKTPPDVGM